MAALGQAATDLTQLSASELTEAFRSRQVPSEDIIGGASSADRSGEPVNQRCHRRPPRAGVAGSETRR